MVASFAVGTWLLVGMTVMVEGISGMGWGKVDGGGVVVGKVVAWGFGGEAGKACGPTFWSRR